MTVIAVALLYTAETSLFGTWRWVAIATALLLMLRDRGDRRPWNTSQIGAAALLGGVAIVAQSVVLGVLAGLIVLPWRNPGTVAWMTLGALGVHLVWWRYAAGMELQRLPEFIAELLSLPLGRNGHITASEFVIGGRAVRFATVAPLPILLPILVATVLSPMRRRDYLIAAAASFCALGTTLAVNVIFVLAGHVHFFAAPWWMLVPTAIGTVFAFASLHSGSVSRPSFPWDVWVATVAAVCLVWLWGPRPTEKPLRIVVDEAHGKWETVEGTLSRDEYGRDSVYNYRLLARWLRARHSVSAIETRDTQIAGDVFVVKMPTDFYSAEEKETIKAFVKAGGLLLAIGDHTNLYGTSLVLNDLLRTYGFELRADATVPWTSEHYDFQPAWWQRSRYLRGISSIQFQTSASIRAHSPLVIPIVVGDRVVAEDAEYSNERFFGDLHPGPEDSPPPIVVAAERRYGKGRVVVFGDSTIFSTFSLMTPGNRELFQNFIELGTSGRSSSRGALLIGMFGAGLILAKTRRLLFGLAVLPPIFTICTAVPLRAELSRYSAEWIEFDSRHSRMELRADPRGTHGPGFDDYSTMVAWTARGGPLPAVTRNAYRDPTISTVVVNPDQSFTGEELDDIEQYIRRGGRLLVLDDPRFAVRSTAGALLERFGIRLSSAAGGASIHDPEPMRLSENILAIPFEILREDRRGRGGERAKNTGWTLGASGMSVSLVDQNGTVIAGHKTVGKGLVAVFLRSVAFSEEVMGDVWVGQEVDPERRRVYQLWYDLIDHIRSRP